MERIRTLIRPQDHRPRVRSGKPKRNIYQQLFDDTKHPAYNLGKNLGPVFTTMYIKSYGINKLYCDGRFDTDSYSISNFMNEYFCHVGKKHKSINNKHK